VSYYFAAASSYPYRPRPLLRVGVGFCGGGCFCELTASGFALCTLLLYCSGCGCRCRCRRCRRRRCCSILCLAMFESRDLVCYVLSARCVPFLELRGCRSVVRGGVVHYRRKLLFDEEDELFGH